MKNVQAGMAQRVLEIDTEVLYQWKDLVPTYEERITVLMAFIWIKSLVSRQMLFTN